LEGVPGLGKTALVKTVGDVMRLDFARIQFTPDMMPADITGTNLVMEDESGRRYFKLQKGPVFNHVILADEINRATPKTQSAMLEAMQERQVSIVGETHDLPRPFFVVATQNPLEMEGTYPLPEAQLDRFLMKLNVEFPEREELREILQRTTSTDNPQAGAVVDGPTILAMRDLVRSVPVAPVVTDYAIRLVLATHPEKPEAPEITRRYVRFGASPRAAQSLLLVGKINALLDGRLNVSADDVKHVARPCMRHRLILNFEGEAERVDTDKIINGIVEVVTEV
ncbi:MAG: AAA family ATPase, partial [Myxococcota bacterium]|nr:AAA family ATPase [Myxococcota bacterium]